MNVKKLILVLMALALLGSSAMAEEWTSYELGCFSIDLPSDWETSYNSDISILSFKQMSNGNYSNILTAMLMSFDNPIDNDEFYEQLYALIFDEFGISNTEGTDILLNAERAYIWSGIKDGNNATGLIYAHSPTALIIVHLDIEPDYDTRLAYMFTIAQHIGIISEG